MRPSRESQPPRDPRLDLPHLSRTRTIVLSLIPALLLWGIAEVSLRVAGFQPSPAVGAMKFTFPLDDYNRSAPEPYLERDDALFWKPRPNVLGHNSKGTFGREFAEAKPAGIIRIVALGDSCTHWGPGPYPQRLQSLLDERAPGRFEVINAGVIGYTSHQGLVRLRTEVARWSPDLVTVYFGWNDHWLARGLRDSQQRPAPWLAAPMGWLRAHSSVVGTLAGAVSKFPSRAASQGEYRVTAREYEENLAAMIHTARGWGTPVWLLTAPHALELGIPRYLVRSGEVADAGKLIDLHRYYNSIVREVARRENATLVDLERVIDDLPKRDLFLRDHIHLADAGRTLTAEILLETLIERGWLDRRADK